MRIMSTHAQCAKAIRIELKKEFPTTKFSVKSDSFSGGDKVSVSWINGPTSQMVNEVISKYQYGHFNGMEDIYENTNRRSDLPQVKYVQSSRDVSEDVIQAIFEELQKTYNHFDSVTTIDEVSDILKDNWCVWTARNYIYRITCKIDLTNGFKGIE